MSRGLVADGCLYGGFLRVIELIYSLSVASKYQVTVGVDGNLNVVVSKLLLHVSEGFTVLDKERGERMPEIVQADMPESGFL